MYEAQAITIRNHVYIGGGSCERGGSGNNECRVFKYNLNDNLWSNPDHIPPLNRHKFSLVAHNERVYALGGAVPRRSQCTRSVIVLSADERKWDDVDQMKTARMQASAVSYMDHIIVAGGKGPQPLSSVEIYSQNEWFEVSPMPDPLFSASCTVLDDQWYILGGCGQGKRMLAVTLADLIQMKNATTENHNPWRHLPNTDLEFSAVVAVRNAVLAVGGKVIRTHNDVQGYFPDMRIWRPIKQSLPFICYNSAAVAISKTEVMVLGGCTRFGRCNDVFRGEICHSEL